jgi:hypothetical protein
MRGVKLEDLGHIIERPGTYNSMKTARPGYKREPAAASLPLRDRR